MSDQDITYVFRDDTTYAIRQGKVIASHADPNEVERLVKSAMGGDPEMLGYMQHGLEGEPDLDRGLGMSDAMMIGDGGGLPASCPECGAPGRPGEHHCPKCGALMPYDPMGADVRDPEQIPEVGNNLDFHAKVITPNGLSGTVLGKTAGLWGDEVTVRLENGRIVKLPIGTPLRRAKQASAPRTTPIEHLERRLAAVPDGTRDSLVARVTEVNRIADSARDLIRDGVAYADSVRLDQLHVASTNEGLELLDAIAALDEAERIEAPRSFSIAAAKEAAGISREDASWLDHTLDEMIKEAEATDFTKLMDEGPEAFTAELPDVALADTGVTRQMASNFISEKTAGIDRQVAEPYMTTFLARIEGCRRAELAGRKQTTYKEAAATEDKYKDLPDDSLFL